MLKHVSPHGYAFIYYTERGGASSCKRMTAGIKVNNKSRPCEPLGGAIQYAGPGGWQKPSRPRSRAWRPSSTPLPASSSSVGSLVDQPIRNGRLSTCRRSSIAIAIDTTITLLRAIPLWFRQDSASNVSYNASVTFDLLCIPNPFHFQLRPITPCMSPSIRSSDRCCAT